jgi:hypothetical protein
LSKLLALRSGEREHDISIDTGDALGERTQQQPLTPPPRPPAARLYALDLLRFGAALFVLGYHFVADTKGAWGPDGPPFAAAGSVLGHGWMGAEFFFAASSP